MVYIGSAMFKSYLKFSFFAFYVFGSQMLALENSLSGPRVEKICVKHIDPNGLGYKYGYSSLDVLLTVPATQSPFMPLLDIRGHVFNNGDFAANAGFGLRYLSSALSQVFGINAFYDYRSTSKNHYNQMSVGLESLGKKWDFRAGGYLLIGEKMSSPFNFSFNLDTYLLTAVREYALSGCEGEVGYHFPKVKRIDFYGAAGSYFYASQKAEENTTGGKFRGVITFLDWINIEGLLSYDHLFKWIGQGAISLNFSFGPKKIIPSADSVLMKRLFQSIEHNEIVVVKKKRKTL